MNFSIIQIRTHDLGDVGALSFIESKEDVDFEFKRCYYIYGASKKTHRGFHAHKQLKQLLFCPYGKIKILITDGHEKEEICLDSPEKGLVVNNGIWREMIWEKSDSVLCVFASEYYDENDYIRDFDVFKKYVEEGYWEHENKL